MASGEDPCPEHPEATRRRDYRYCFSRKHHGRRDVTGTQWAEDLTQDEEFAIFNESDEHDLSDAKGNFYGSRRTTDGIILDLGTEGEQIAKFWDPEKNQPTHGFPLWPLAESGPKNRNQEHAPREALLKMETEHLLSRTQLKRLLKGDRAR